MKHRHTTTLGLVALVAASAWVCACSSDSSGSGLPPPQVDAGGGGSPGDGAAGTAPDASDSGVDVLFDAPYDALDTSRPDVPADTGGPEVDSGGDAGSSLFELRAIIHAHSAYSHDGCDGRGIVNGVVDGQCISELRQAPCTLGLDLVSLTDHPSNMQDYPLEVDMLYDPNLGDELVMVGGQAVANRITCADGHKVLFTAGFEDQHSMPLGLHQHLAGPASYEGITDATPVAEAQDLVNQMKQAGAVASLVHSEQPNISPPLIDAAGFEAMEVYNIHGTLEALLGGDSIGGDPLGAINKLSSINAFLFGSTSGAHPDLVYLLTTASWPQAGFDKWYEVQKSRPITGMLGTDIHRNISVDPICTGATYVLCQAAAALYPHVLTLLLNGGTIALTDGERMDSYRRVMGWLENRLLVTEATPQAIADALRGGQTYGLFSIFGAAQGFGFSVRTGAEVLPMGSVVQAPATLIINTPTRPEPLRTVQFTPAEADTAQIRVTLLHTTSQSTQVVQEITAPGQTIEVPISDPGAWHVEIRIRPWHLAAALGTRADLAQYEYLWVISNPVRIAPP